MLHPGSASGGCNVGIASDQGGSLLPVAAAVVRWWDRELAFEGAIEGCL